MEKLEKISIHEVNKLVENSFGKGFRGDYYYHFGVSMTTEGYEIGNGLELIAKNPESIFFNKIAGFFGSDFGDYPKDGSVLTVLPKYRGKASKYSELYEKSTGKKAKIFITSSLK